MTGTMARARSVSFWLLHPTCLIDTILDQLDRLSVVLALPAPEAGLLRSQAPVEARLAEHLAT